MQLIEATEPVSRERGDAIAEMETGRGDATGPIAILFDSSY
jgi:hypothetical protein